MSDPNCTGCGQQKPDDGLRLCEACAKLVDDAFDEMGFDPESVIAAASTSTRKP